jgi:hypothetical protein
LSVSTCADQLANTVACGVQNGTITILQDSTPSPSPGASPGPAWGDIDCNGAVNPVDALKLLRHASGLTYPRPTGCPIAGATYP